MDIRKLVLVVVDMQVGFLNAHSEHVVTNVLKLVRECSRRKIPTIFTKFINRPVSPFERLLGWRNVREEPETDLCGPVLPFAQVVIEKNFYTAFTTEFLKSIEAAGWDTVLICGVSTESCVLKTAVDAFERELTPIVVADACASNLGDKMHRHGLEVMKVLIGNDQILKMSELLMRF